MQQPLHLLIFDQNLERHELLKANLLAQHHMVSSHHSAESMVAAASGGTFDVLFIDAAIPPNHRTPFIPMLRRFQPRANLVLIGDKHIKNPSAEFDDWGVDHILLHPDSPQAVWLVLRDVLSVRALKLRVAALQANAEQDPDAQFHTANPILQRALDLAKQVAQSQAPILIRAELGSGADRLAHAIHQWSPRSDAPLAVIKFTGDSAASIEEDLFGLASETGVNAPPDKPGQVMLCNGGTVVLDEINACPSSLQPRIERLLKDHQYERRDDFAPRQADVRVIATTRFDLPALVRQNRFRRELLMALDVVRIEIPPLRDRPEDIPALAENYLRFFARQNNSNIVAFTTEAMNALQKHRWSANQQELRNFIERAVLLCPGEQIELAHFPTNFLNEGCPCTPGDLVSLQAIEDLHIRGVLAATGTVKAAATVLGINYSTLWRRLRK